MRIHHPDCASLCPPARRFLQGEGGWLEPAHIVCHCLLIEGREGLVPVDTGFGDGLMSGRRPLPMDARQLGLRPAPERRALAQIRALGLDPHDVRDIVLTHLGFDHAGSLPDFPWARVHVYGAELAATPPRPPGLALTQRLLATMDDRQRCGNPRRLHALKHAHGEIDVFCAHCPHEFNILQAAA